MPPKKKSNSPKRKSTRVSSQTNVDSEVKEEIPPAGPTDPQHRSTVHQKGKDDDSSIFKFLISTDNHLGYAERDPRRGDDSFTTFEEILRAARIEHNVDAILLGGDLFHDNKPTLGCLARTLSLFRKYVFGDKEIEFTLRSDPTRNFPTHALHEANFRDPNMNVATPVFAIHGNHDDPVGGTSALDILATAGCINYFGHVQSLEEIVVEPVLLQKGDTYVALYGLGNVRDERLHRCFRDGKVHFLYPKPQEGVEWFHILLLHQNRGVRGRSGPGGTKAGIYEEMLAGFKMDLVIWGNEHEQLMMPQPSTAGTFDVIQPGSSIFTSLSAQESNPKQYGILEVKGTSYRLTPYNLMSVRPVVRRTVQLYRDNPKGRTLEAVEEYLRDVVVGMVEEAETQVAAIPQEILQFHPNIIYPLMRLSVDFSDPDSAPFPQPNANRFGQQYMDVIANANDLLKPIKPKAGPTLGAMINKANRENAEENEFVYPVRPNITTTDIRAKVAEVFFYNAKDACVLLPEHEVSAAVYAFVEKGEKDAIDERISELINVTQKAVWREFDHGNSENILKTDKIVDAVHRHKKEMNKKYVAAEQLSMKEAVEDLEEDKEEEGEEKKKKKPTPEVDLEEEEEEEVGGSSNFLSSVNGGGGGNGLKREPRAPLMDPSVVYEELPGDGLDKSTVEHIVADAITVARNTTTVKKRERVEDDHDVISIDDDDDEENCRRGVGKKGNASGRRKAHAPPRKTCRRKEVPGVSGPALNVTTAVPISYPTRSTYRTSHTTPAKPNQNPSVLNVVAQWGSPSQK